jgi:SAM-dependent methyltransferase
LTKQLVTDCAARTYTRAREQLKKELALPLTLRDKDTMSNDTDIRSPKAVCSAFPPVLDVCCGSRMFWFDKQDGRALFVDKRRETWPIDRGTPGTVGRSPIVVDPDTLADFTALPFPDNTFAHVVFDPPHVERRQGTGIIEQKYGWLDGDWRDMLRKGFAECFRVLRPEGTLIFKWCEYDVPVAEVLALTPEKPLYGHRSGKQSKTHWIAFLKPNSVICRKSEEHPCPPL